MSGQMQHSPCYVQPRTKGPYPSIAVEVVPPNSRSPAMTQRVRGSPDVHQSTSTFSKTKFFMRHIAHNTCIGNTCLSM